MLKLFKKKETDKEIEERILKLTLTDGKDYGICSPPMEAQK